MDFRWVHLLERAEALVELAERGNTADEEQVWLAIEESLLDLDVVFPREVEPLADMEGFALRQYVLALIRILGRLRPRPVHPYHQTGNRMTPELIHVTDTDLQRLEELLSHLPPSRNLTLLENELARARVVGSEEIPADVVTMNSRVRFRDLHSGDEREVTLVYPNAASFDHGRVSVLAPVGAALLGLAVGDDIDWPMPSGESRRLRVVAVPFQPEAAGRFDL
jgi:regulator of nucleoside diphosphate kinase